MENPLIKTVNLVCDSIIEEANAVKAKVTEGKHNQASQLAYRLFALVTKLDDTFDTILMDDTVTSPPEETERLRKEYTERRRKEETERLRKKDLHG